ncbi:hypothetical protein, partial [Streptomyces roseolus]|uniref:hypothetical protein n=1 Tax=Streptomyces roseolus TaxID=67358 RepID=UPI0036608D09
MPSDERCRSEDECGKDGQSLKAGLSGEVAVLDAVDRVPVGCEVGRHDDAGKVGSSTFAPHEEHGGERVEQRQGRPVEVEPARCPVVGMQPVAEEVGDVRGSADEEQD